MTIAAAGARHSYSMGKAAGETEAREQRDGEIDEGEESVRRKWLMPGKTANPSENWRVLARTSRGSPRRREQAHRVAAASRGKPIARTAGRRPAYPYCSQSRVPVG
jgi:hypothetical protein